MLSINPIKSFNTQYHSQFSNNAFGEQRKLSLSNDSFTPQVSFGKFTPDRNHVQTVRKIVQLIKDPKMKKIAIISHYNPDGDAIGASVGLKNMILESMSKEVVQKDVDVLVLNPIPNTFKSIIPQQEVKVISELIEHTGDSNTITAESVKAKFGIYDLAIMIDVPTTVSLDKSIANGILKNARKTIRIDHHVTNTILEPNKDFVATLNFVDQAKESTAQLVMQLAKTMGIDVKNVSREITNPLLFGVYTDTKSLQHIRSPKVFMDVAQLTNTADYKKIRQASVEFSDEEFDAYKNLMPKIKFTKDRTIGYFILKKVASDESKSILRQVQAEMLKAKSVKYCFSIYPTPNCAKYPAHLVITSKDMPLNSIREKLGACGTEDYVVAGLKTKDFVQVKKAVIQMLEKLKQSKS